MHLTIKDKHAVTPDLQEFLPQHCAWVLKALPEPVEATPLGNGSERDPWRMGTIGQWAEAAKIELAPWKADRSPADPSKLPEWLENARKRKPDRGLYLVGGRLLERSPAGEYSNYITDVVDGGAAIIGSRDSTTTKGVTAIGRPRAFSAPVRDGTPVYEVKYARLRAGAEAAGLFFNSNSAETNSALAKEARRLLSGEQKMIHDVDELPGTVAAMFLAEVSREPRMLVLGLMLLDLIEAKTTGFTWSSLMTNEGSLPGVQHPMVHFNAQKQAKQMFENFENNVTKKSVAVLTAWLKHYLDGDTRWEVAQKVSESFPKKLPGQLTQIAQTLGVKNEPASGKTKVFWNFYNYAVLPALQARANTLDKLL